MMPRLLTVFTIIALASAVSVKAQESSSSTGEDNGIISVEDVSSSTGAESGVVAEEESSSTGPDSGVVMMSKF